MKVILLFVLAVLLIIDETKGHSSNVFLRDVEHSHDDADHLEEKLQATKPLPTASKGTTPEAASAALKGTVVKPAEPKPLAKPTTTTATNNVKVAPTIITTTTSPKVASSPAQVVADDVDDVEIDEDDDEENEIEETVVPPTKDVKQLKEVTKTVTPEKAKPSKPVVESTVIEDEGNDEEEDEEDDEELEEKVKEVKKTEETSSQAKGESGSNKTKTESSNNDIEEKLTNDLEDLGKGDEEIIIIWEDVENLDGEDKVTDDGEIKDKLIGAIVDLKDEDYQGDQEYIDAMIPDLNIIVKPVAESAGKGFLKGDEVGDDKNDYKTVDKAQDVVKDKVQDVTKTSEGQTSEKKLNTDKNADDPEDYEGAGKGPLFDDFDDDEDVLDVEELKPAAGSGGVAEDGVCSSSANVQDCNESAKPERWFQWLFDLLD